MHDSLPLRLARTGDIPALHALIESAYRGDSARTGWTHEADLLDGQRTDPEALAAAIAADDEALLVDEADGTLLGCVQLKRAGPGRVYLGLFTVRPGLQGQGRGKRLLAAAEDHAVRAMGATTIEMTVIRQRTELIGWYQRRGYRLTGETRPFPLDDTRFGLPTRRDLEFVVLEKCPSERAIEPVELNDI